MKTSHFLIIMGLAFSLSNCNNKSYYKSYTKVNGKYIKNYVENTSFESNEAYFHEKYGIIKHYDGFWRDENNSIIYELGQTLK